jgi:VanZ family protein
MYKIIGADQVEYGPVTAGQLCEWIAQGRANATSLVWAEGAVEWKPLAAVPEFSAALGSASTTPQTIRPNIAPRPQTNSMAITGLILGILSVLLGWCFFNVIFSILGLIFSCVGLSQIKKNPGQQTGRGLAIAGIILSCLGLVMGVVVAVLFGVLAVIGNNAN